MNKILFLAGLIFTLFVYSCDDKQGEDQSLPAARGGVGEIILVMDSASWRGDLGDALRTIFREPIPGLPQDEPMYTLRYVNPMAMNDVLRNAKNMIFVTTIEGNSMADKKLRSYFTKESMEKIKSDPDIFMFKKQDEFARGQSILHLFGQNKAMLASKLEENALQIRSYFDEAEEKRLKKTLFAKQEKDLQKAIESKHQFSINIPFGYKLAKNEEDFVWLRQLGRETDRNIFISYRDYDEEGLFSKSSILDLRESVAKEHIFDSGNPDLFMTTQRIAPIDTTVINFKGLYAVEARGLWKLNDNSLGGPFVSYTLVDEKLNRLYYIEGYVSSPGKDKRNFVKELETILSTFRPST